MTHLVKKLITVRRGGKTFTQTRMVKPSEPKAEPKKALAKVKEPHPDIKEASDPATPDARLQGLSVLNGNTPTKHMQAVREKVAANPNASPETINEVLSQSQERHEQNALKTEHERNVVRAVNDNPALLLLSLEQPNLDLIRDHNLSMLVTGKNVPDFVFEAAKRRDAIMPWVAKECEDPARAKALVLSQTEPLSRNIFARHYLNNSHVTDAEKIKTLKQVQFDPHMIQHTAKSVLESPSVSAPVKAAFMHQILPIYKSLAMTWGGASGPKSIISEAALKAGVYKVIMPEYPYGIGHKE